MEYMDSCELVLFISALACSISECCDEDQIGLLAVIFTQLGDTLTTISVRNGMCNEKDKE